MERRGERGMRVYDGLKFGVGGVFGGVEGGSTAYLGSGSGAVCEAVPEQVDCGREHFSHQGTSHVSTKDRFVSQETHVVTVGGHTADEGSGCRTKTAMCFHDEGHKFNILI